MMNEKIQAEIDRANQAIQAVRSNGTSKVVDASLEWEDGGVLYLTFLVLEIAAARPIITGDGEIAGYKYGVIAAEPGFRGNSHSTHVFPAKEIKIVKEGQAVTILPWRDDDFTIYLRPGESDKAKRDQEQIPDNPPGLEVMLEAARDAAKGVAE